MGAAVGYALSHGAASALAVFGALGLGFSAPMLAIAALPGLAGRLPKAGAWTERFREALGFPMMAAALWMAWLLSGLGGAGALVSLLEGLLAAGLGAWAWGAWGGLDRTRRSRLAAGAVALACLAASLAWSISGARDAAIQSARARSAARADASPGAAPVPRDRDDGFWRPWSDDALAELRKGGRPVFVDFTADWCLSCRLNEAVALDAAAVRARFAELGVVALKADWTARDEAIGRALAALGRASVPVYALYAPGAEAPVLLPELLSPGIVLRYLDENLADRR
jgi:thiol:disulfide interchange protein DsbD